MDEQQWESARPSDGIGAIFGRGRVLLAIGIAALAMVAYLGQGSPAISDASRPQAATLPQSSETAATVERSTASNASNLRRDALAARHRAHTVAQFPQLVTGPQLARLEEVAARLVGVLPGDLAVRPTFRVELAESNLEYDYAFTDGYLLLTTGFVEKLQTPGQVAAVLSQMMERVLATVDARYRHAPWSRLAVNMTTQAGFDPRAMSWLLDYKQRSVAVDLPNAEERIRVLQLQSNRVTDEIATLYPRGVPDHLIK